MNANVWKRFWIWPRQERTPSDVNRLDLGDIYYVGIDLERAMLKPGSSADIVLREGDVIEIPEYNNTVRISGAVMYPNTVSFEDGKTLKYYIEQAGGYGFRAREEQGVYCIYERSGEESEER